MYFQAQKKITHCNTETISDADGTNCKSFSDVFMSASAYYLRGNACDTVTDAYPFERRKSTTACNVSVALNDYTSGC